MLVGFIDDRSLLVCHLQWYLDEMAQGKRCGHARGACPHSASHRADRPEARASGIELDEDAAVLVRPDGHVAWRSRRLRASELPGDVLREVLSTVLDRCLGAEMAEQFASSEA